jgi:hypothetical protein
MDGTPNAAPMGATMLDPKTLNLSIYNSSQTSRNLKTSVCAVVNLINDIDVFYKTTFKEANPTGQLPQEWFEKAEKVNAPKLRLAEATIDITIVNVESVEADKSKFTCKVKQIDAPKMYPQVICRAKSLTLEAIINATRVKAFVKDANQQKTVNKLLASIEDSNALIKRVAPNSTYGAVMADLLLRIDSWRTKP